MAIVDSKNDPIAQALLKMVGCPPNVRSLVYKAEVNQVTCVIVEYFPEIDLEGVESLKAITQKFQLVPMPEKIEGPA